MIKAIAVALGLTMCGSAAWADFSGVRIQYRGLDIQLSSAADDMDEQTRELLFGSPALASRIAKIVAGQPDRYFGRRLDLTVEIEPSGSGFSVRYLSGTIREVDQRFPDGQTNVGTPEQIVATVCDLLKLSGCDTLPAQDRAARAPRAAAGPADPRRDVVLTIGALPSSDPTKQVAVPRNQTAPGARSSRPQDRTQGPPLDDAIRSRANEAFPRGGGRSAPADDRAAEDRRSVSRKYFTVHCTAFGASEPTMHKWVAARAGKSRNKSQGVVLPSGDYLPLWPLEETRVWATKTETCRQTSGTALGAMLNIELHYFCADNRSDKPTEAQYTRLADIYKQAYDKYGPLTIVSHREVDRGLRDGHGDPTQFSFQHFYEKLKAKGINTDAIPKISDQRHALRTGPDISHHWPPKLAGALDFEPRPPDDCQRDH